MEMKRMLLSIQRCLLEKITPNLRCVRIITIHDCKSLVFYYDNPPSEEEQELASLADTEFISDFPDDDTGLEIKIISYPQKIPHEGLCVYHRHEPNIE